MSLKKMLVCLWLAVVALTASAQAYPDRPIVWVVPYSAGGGVDAVARMVGKYVSEVLKTPIVVENRPGPGGTVGANHVARSKPDGYTFVVGGSGPLSISPHIMKGLPYDPLKDLKPVSLLVTVPQILVVRAGGRFPDFNSFMATARKERLSLGYGSNGSGQHLSALALQHFGKVEFTLIPYKGTANVINDLLGGTIDAAYVDPSSIGLVKNGRLIAFGVTMPKRSAANPTIPTLQEIGLSGAEFQSFYALSGPADMPDSVVATMGQAVRQVLTRPDVIDAMREVGFDPAPSTSKEAASFIQEHSRHAAGLLKSVGISPTN
jgi:tripartite-type tricarboxylate transporter receptor subunit TctC